MFLLTFLLEIFSQLCFHLKDFSRFGGLLLAALSINGLTLMLLVANFANTQLCKKPEK